MDKPKATPTPWSPTGSCYAFAAFQALGLTVALTVLRFVLLIQFMPAGTFLADAGHVLGAGIPRDLFAAIIFTAPFLLWMQFVPTRWTLTAWHRWLFWCFCFVYWFALIFLLFVEYFFFDEFKSRFNTVAVDYLIYPREVFVNIWDSYHVGIVVGICLAISAGWLVVVARTFRNMWTHHFSPFSRLLRLLLAAAMAVSLAYSFDFNAAHVGPDRTLNEIANNGSVSFITAWRTGNLDYSAYYKTLPTKEAYQRARRMLSEPNSKFVDEGESIRRRIEGDSSRPRLNVVIMLEESLGSEFWGCLGRKDTLTPWMDKLAVEEGLLFDNMYACGNRTVRGFEGVLSSFPPLPGDSIVKRSLSDNVETIARVLKRDGYSTLFLYGGRGLFDGMRSYAVRNGYDRFIEQKHFDHPTFLTIWGVSDEDLFDRAIEEMRALSQTNKPFLATMLSVSNHKPFTYPRGRIRDDPVPGRRENAVEYSDWCLGHFFQKAKQESFWTNTIFVVIADHGARVYGQQSIPIESYKIPLVILGPSVVKAPARISQRGSSLDVSPTILGFLGRPYQSLFFGRDLFKMQPKDGRCFLNHNRDIGMLTTDRMVVLGLQKTSEFYSGDPRSVEMAPLTHPTDADRELEKDTISIYQVADDLYMHQRYRLDP